MPAAAVIIWKKPLPPSMLGVTLPSGESANDVLEQKPGSLTRLTLHWLGRSAIVGVGLALVGLRGVKLVKYALAAGTAIEIAVLLFAWKNRGEPLPSGDNASALIEGKPGAFLKMVGIFIGRALQIGAGVWLGGERDVKQIVKYSLAGSAAVETFVQVFALLFHGSESAS